MMKACRNLNKISKQRLTRASGRKSPGDGDTVQPVNTLTLRVETDAASWQRIAAAVDRVNAELMQRMAEMDRMLRRLRTQIARNKLRVSHDA